MPRKRRYQDAVPITVQSKINTPRPANVARPGPLRRIKWTFRTVLDFLLGKDALGHLALLRLPAENATRNTPSDHPEDSVANDAQSG